ncbi:hypothetical protein DPMN_150348 [Dreissena polymorpha]|uniref:Uncharacterized protein n=1 Tax=Dreissena polymorpha TaxID=45954 RepID=A0A9D4J688_DREPO|nr:hypothetical protein DPMN_150348 [Dreissena polymorpha]
MEKLLRSTLKKTTKDDQNMVKKLFKSVHSSILPCVIYKNTLDETKRSLKSLKAYLKASVETCIRQQNELKTLNELLLYSSDKNKKKLCFIAVRKSMKKTEHVESNMNENCVKIEYSVLYQTLKTTEQYIFKFSCVARSVESEKTYNDIEQYLSRLSSLVRIVCSNHVFTVIEKSEHNLRIPSNQDKLTISAICALPDRQILVLDSYHKNVKLLNQHYQVVSQCSVAGDPREMCQITPSEVALKYSL